MACDFETRVAEPWQSQDRINAGCASDRSPPLCFCGGNQDLKSVGLAFGDGWETGGLHFIAVAIFDAVPCLHWRELRNTIIHALTMPDATTSARDSGQQRGRLAPNSGAAEVVKKKKSPKDPQQEEALPPPAFDDDGEVGGAANCPKDSFELGKSHTVQDDTGRQQVGDVNVSSSADKSGTWTAVSEELSHSKSQTTT